MEKKRKALIIGATGLVGNELLRRLLNSDLYEHVTALTRRPIAIAQKNPKYHERVLDFDEMDQAAGEFSVDDVFCCLGTTIKKAGSKEAFRKVDYEYPVKAAELARAQGASQYLVVSAIGANPDSKVFYSRVKGELESALIAMHFDSLHLMHPSLLLGKRDEFRTAEGLSGWLSPVFSPLLRGRLAKFKPIKAEDVASAMLQIAADGEKGTNIYEWPELYEAGKRDA